MTDILDRAAAIVEQATPGPWKAKVYRRTKVADVRIADGPPIVDWPGFDDCNRPFAAHARNARLIALAPSLGAALALAKAASRLADAGHAQSPKGNWCAECSMLWPCPDAETTAALAAFKASLAESIKED